MKFLSAFFFMTVGMGLAVPAAMAEDAKPAKKEVKKETTHHAEKKAAPKKTAQAKKETAAPAAAQDEDDIEPDIASSTATEINCELNNKLTIYRNLDDDKHIALRWKKQLLRLNRVETTTGAHRFENRKNGLVWIDIPAKGMLLDAKKGQQLANECKRPDQVGQKLTAEASAN
jgi:hypothetical protein